MSMVTLKDVAARAGVAHSTVSYALGRCKTPMRIGDATVTRVQRAARELGYVANFAGQALRTQRTRNIGLLLSDELSIGQTSHAILGERIAALDPPCVARGYNLLLLHHDFHNPDRTLERLAARPVDGLLLTGLEDEKVLTLCQRMHLPVVDVVGTWGKAPVCAVEADLVSARHEAVRYAHSLGHRRIGVFAYDLGRHRQLFADAAALVAADPALTDGRLTRIDLGTRIESPAAAKLAIEAWLALPDMERPTLLMGYGDLMTGFLGELASRGLRCPRDVSLLSLSTPSTIEITVPRLTSIDNAVQPCAARGVELLLDAVESGRPLTSADSPPRFGCRLTVRDSCAPTHTPFTPIKPLSGEKNHV